MSSGIKPNFLNSCKSVLEIFDNIKIDSLEIDFSIRHETHDDFDTRTKLQKINYLLKEVFDINIFNYFDEFYDDYSWYMKGPYSTGFAAITYNISLNSDFIRNADISKIEVYDKIFYSQINEYLGQFCRYLNINDEKTFISYLLVLVSIIYIRKEYKRYNREMIYKSLEFLRCPIDYTEFDKIIDFYENKKI